ncbi:MAG: hypothetical protein RMK57_09475 [Bryobacterales bacterium]|nr:hypothetical protein [Bryobacteraceae bacterium]MDW8354747.1 hypothetical protein [Bryobacterales bacterium]
MTNESLSDVQALLGGEPSLAEQLFGSPFIEGDVGPKVIEQTRRRLHVDRKHAILRERGFTWWPGDFAQHVDAAPPRRDARADVVRVRITTDWLCEVPDTPKTLALLSEASHLATMNAFVWDRAAKTISLSATVYCHSQNLRPGSLLVATCAVLQFFESAAWSPAAAELGAKLARSPRPHARKSRTSASKQMEELVESLRAGGTEPCKFSSEEFYQARAMLGPEILAFASDNGLTAELPFFGSIPAALAPANQTALLQVQGCEHPVIGSGAWLVLRLPVDCDRDLGGALAAHLNGAESWEWTRCHQLGSWCWDETTGLMFVSFIPSALAPMFHLGYFVMPMGLRSRWAFAELWHVGAITSQDVVARCSATLEEETEEERETVQ